MYTLQVDYWEDDRSDWIDTRTCANARKAAEAISLLSNVAQVSITGPRSHDVTDVYTNGLLKMPSESGATQERRSYIWSDRDEPADPWAVSS